MRILPEEVIEPIRTAWKAGFAMKVVDEHLAQLLIDDMAAQSDFSLCSAKLEAELLRLNHPDLELRQ